GGAGCRGSVAVERDPGREGRPGSQVLIQGYCDLSSLMLPLTVDKVSGRPPLPMVPFRRRGLNGPVTVIGKSAEMLPFNVSARRPASTTTGSLRVMPPLTLLNVAPSGQSARPIATSTAPLTVLATARPDVVMRTDPFTEGARASPLPPLTSLVRARPCWQRH